MAKVFVELKTYGSPKMHEEKLDDVFSRRRSAKSVLSTADLRILNMAQGCGGCTIAGGAALALYNGELKFLKDWDLFFNSMSSFNRVRNKFLDMGFEETRVSDFGITLELKGYGESSSAKVNLIDYIFPNNVQELFDSFDFTVCCFAISGDKIIYTDLAKKDEEKKLLNVVSLKKENIALTFKRIARYGLKGYVPSNEFVLKVGDFFRKKDVDAGELELVVSKGGSGS